MLTPRDDREDAALSGQTRNHTVVKEEIRYELLWDEGKDVSQHDCWYDQKESLDNNIRVYLCEAEIQHGLIHPARLIITSQGATKTFLNPQDEEAYYNNSIKPTLRSK